MSSERKDKTLGIESCSIAAPKDCLNAFTTALEAELRDPKGVAKKIARGPSLVGA